MTPKQAFHPSPRVGLTLLVLLGALAISCGKKAVTGEDSKITGLGTVEITAELLEIPGEFVDRADYDYAFVLKYRVIEVHRGKVEGDTLYVAQYNPLEPRASVADERVPEIGGNLQSFRVGEVHRMALEVPIDDYFMGGIINRYFEQYSGPVYWAVWTNKTSL